jgi:predicted enzyme related to lactoylglutathione lyase
MMRAVANPIVHLELQTANLPRACAFYTRLFEWRAEVVHVGRESYLALEPGAGIEAGVVERETKRPIWLPYVAVEEIREVTDRARQLGAGVILEPREGPTGWRSVLAGPAGAEIALWQPKSRA